MGHSIFPYDHYAFWRECPTAERPTAKEELSKSDYLAKMLIGLEDAHAFYVNTFDELSTFFSGDGRALERQLPHAVHQLPVAR